MQKSPDNSSGSSALDVRVAEGRRELAEAYELVFRSYVQKGYIEPRPRGIVYQRSFGLPFSRTLIASTPTQGIIGTLTVVGDNPLGLQLETAFPLEMQALRARGRHGCEITCLAIERADGIRQTEVFFEMTKFMLHHAVGRGYDDLLMVIHPRQYRFYWRHYRTYVEGCRQVYPCAGGNPGLFSRIDVQYLDRNMTPKVRQRYFTEVLPPRHYQGPKINLADHRYFCARSGIDPDAAAGDWVRWERSVA